MALCRLKREDFQFTVKIKDKKEKERKKSRTMGGSLAIVIRDGSATNEDNGIKAFGWDQNGNALKAESLIR